ncbi:MAG: hypothetical protein JXA93_18075, partial [Anaerolineae bacterium]|nr:hypothetical protein [Anaerolineae bacterium]
MKNRIFVRLVRVVLLAIVIEATIVACSHSAIPPGANKVLGSVEQGGYLFLRWQEGLTVMIWHDLAGESTADSAGSPAGQVYVERGSAFAHDGRSFDWMLQTADGRTGEIRIGSDRYDLAAGTLFLVTTRDGALRVRQLAHDLSGVAPNDGAVRAFGHADPDVAAFLDANPTPAPPGTAMAPTPMETSTPSPTATSAPATTDTPRPPTPTATQRPAEPPPATSVPLPPVERILFAPGATQALIEGYLPEGGCALYVMAVSAGQLVEVDATIGSTGQGLRFAITGADGAVIKPMGHAHVQTVVPSTQDYFIDLVSDMGATSYQLSVLIPVRIRFAPGATSAMVDGTLSEGEARHYVLRAMTGQRLIVDPGTSRGQLRMIIAGADGQVLLRGNVGDPGGVFDGVLPTTQDYLITVRPVEGSGVDYTLEITIPAL